MVCHVVGVPEWLSGMTRNHVGFARAGSNPAAHDVLKFLCLFSLFHDMFYLFIIFFMVWFHQHVVNTLVLEYLNLKKKKKIEKKEGLGLISCEDPMVFKF